MSKPLIVVESPTKIKTIKKYVGDKYEVSATVGHIKDLPQKEIGVDIDNDFKPNYVSLPGKQKVIRSLKQSAGDTTEVYLAPDPDREGEAIAWHTSQVLKKKGRRFYRVLFHELTKNAILNSLENPEELNREKYEAQQTRRILDRLVGYQISPLLWRKVKGGLSAGRVQSVAVRIICERERAIQAFNPEEYWSVTAHLEGSEPPPFGAKLVKKNSKKISIPNKAVADQILEDLRQADFIIDKIQKKTTKRNPQPPFITSKLQQEAIHKLRFSAKKTMVVAQQLYEGIEIGPGEQVGLITYMRTDSIRISSEAADEALVYIAENFGKAYVLPKPRFFQNKKKAQDAHEAIRPTSVSNTPEKLAAYLSKDQLALYQLIWKRFVASQMEQALIDNNTISIKAADYRFNASGSSVKFPGFMILYMTAEEEATKNKEQEKTVLPDLQEGMSLKVIKIDPKQHFTVPPPRFSEASLVKELEENGIGRPSTYASILSTIRDKGYVDLISRYFRPSELGFIVNDLIVSSFTEEFDIAFTAKMEDDLDKIESAEANATDILKNFYAPFKKRLEAATETMVSVKGVGLPTNLACPKCSKTLHIKMGKNGHFLACSGYPDCKFTRDYERNEKGTIVPIEPEKEKITDQTCDKCHKPLVVKRGKFGTFLACSGYPECTYTRSINANGPMESTGISCPTQDCSGEIVQRTSKRGKIFYGCNRFPKCNFAIWDKPVPSKCPQCGASFLLEKTTKKEGTFLTCHVKECGYRKTTE